MSAIQKIANSSPKQSELRNERKYTPIPSASTRVSYNDGKSVWGGAVGKGVINKAEIDVLKEEMGQKFNIVEKIRTYFVSRIDELEKENRLLREKMENYLVGIPPLPDRSNAVEEITSTKQLLSESIKVDSYRDHYMKTEAMSNMQGRIELIAYLDIIRDFAKMELDPTLTPEDYFQSAIDGVDMRINFFMHEAREEGISLAKYINDFVLPEIRINTH